jgi:hypothetical protein
VAALFEEVFWVRFLEVPAADFLRWNLRGDGQNGHTASMGVIEAIDEVKVARSTATGADRELSC